MRPVEQVPVGAGKTLYVSQWGDHSDGRSWRTAFHTIQAALAAVPDAEGGYRIVVRPDTYMEANLFPAHPGAAGAPHELVGDFDGRLGSGATRCAARCKPMCSFSRTCRPECCASGPGRWQLSKSCYRRRCPGDIPDCESNDSRYPAFTIKFATSPNLTEWQKLPDAVYGADRYAACPCIRYVDGWYYILYLEHRTPRWFFETCLARSRDLRDWESAPGNPLLTPGFGDGINASDPDVVEFGGATYVYYSVGDQRSWSRLKRAVFPGSLAGFFQDAFAPVVPVAP